MPDLAFLEVFGDVGTKTAETPASLVGSILGQLRSGSDLGQFEQELQQSWSQPLTPQDAFDLLRQSLQGLRHQQGRVWEALKQHTKSVNDMQQATSLVHAHFSGLIHTSNFAAALTQIMIELGRCSLNLARANSIQGIPTEPEKSRAVLTDLVEALKRVGLAETLAPIAWAEAVLAIVVELTQTRYQSNETSVEILSQMMKDTHAEFEDLILSLDLLPNHRDARHRNEDQEQKQVEQMTKFLTDQAVDAFGRMRLDQLADTITQDHHPGFSTGFYDDIQRYFLMRPVGREVAEHRLRECFDDNFLSPGRSTSELLDVYVRLIKSLLAVDPSGKTLTESSVRLISFLRTRTDVVPIIVNSFLERSQQADGQRRMSSETFCVSVAECMENDSNQYVTKYYEGDDTQDPNWTPAPAGTASGQRFSRFNDGFYYLVTLESQEVFVKVLQDCFAARVIGTATGEKRSAAAAFQAEMRLLNTLKQRFPQFETNKCEIMLRDMLDSERLNADIELQKEPIDFKAVVLSRCSWPIMPTWDSDCGWSASVKESAEAWAGNFATLRPRRRLEWLACAGRTTVELELADRTVTEDCAPFQAVVIQHFDEDDSDSSAMKTPKAKSRTVHQLAQRAQMDEDLVRAACSFWVTKQVLTATDEDTFIVQERLPARTRHSHGAAATPPHQRQRQTAAAAAATKAGKSKTASEQLAENKGVYSQYVLGLLTNQGAQKAARIHAVLRVMIPGGFPYDEPELRDLLADMAAAGRLHRQADLWMVAAPSK